MRDASPANTTLPAASVARDRPSAVRVWPALHQLRPLWTQQAPTLFSWRATDDARTSVTGLPGPGSERHPQLRLAKVR